MTSPLQLFNIWRSPDRRSQELVGALETDHPDPDHDLRRCRRDRRHGRRGSDSGPSRHANGRAPKTRHSKTCCSHATRREHALGSSSHNVNEGDLPGNRCYGGVSYSTLTRLGLTRNGQLPGVVEEARKRLLERLRSVSLTENRQRALDADVLNDESAVGDGFIANHATLNHENQRPNLNILFGESSIQTQQASSFTVKNKKIAALSWDAFCTMKGETFRSSEEKNEGGIMEALTECCICLEGFKDEDRLVKLCCSHKFHHTCLEPWVRSSGDCPLCRADII